jgi:hypothetical protein
LILLVTSSFQTSCSKNAFQLSYDQSIMSWRHWRNTQKNFCVSKSKFKVFFYQIITLDCLVCKNWTVVKWYDSSTC